MKILEAVFLLENAIEQKSFRFAVRIVKLCKYLRKSKREVTLSTQLLRCGTSIGANVAESQQAQSKADFISKLNIALKETSETKYWLCLLHETQYLTDREFNSIYPETMELEKLLTSIIKSSANH